MENKKNRGYSPETLKKLKTKIDEKITEYENVEISAIPLCISAGNVKIGRTLNVSKMPVRSCPNCTECIRFCYDIKACIQYANVMDARMRNQIIFERDRDEFFSRIAERMGHVKKSGNKYLRYHVGGEMKDSDEFSRLVQIAHDFPDFRIWTYTKNYEAVNAYVREHGNSRACVPANLSVMFSEWKGMEIVNPFDFPVFRCFDPETETERPTCYKCPGNCDVCKKHNRGCIKGEDVYTDLH